MEESLEISVSNDALQQISVLATRQLNLEGDIKEMEEALKKLGEDLRRVQEVDLPNAMAEAGMKAFTLNNGAKITIKDDVAVSIPKDQKHEAYQWLRDNGFGDVIKHNVVVEFGKEDDEAAIRLMQYCEKQGKRAEDQQSVHAQTLKALVKEQLANGKEIPLDLFGAYPYSKAVIK